MNRRVDRLVVELADGAIPREILLPQINEYHLRKEDLENRLDQLRASLLNAKGSSIDPTVLESMLSGLDLRLNHGDPDEKKALLLLLIQDISVSMFPSRRVTAINLSFNLCKQSANPLENYIPTDEEGFNSFVIGFPL